MIRNSKVLYSFLGGGMSHLLNRRESMARCNGVIMDIDDGFHFQMACSYKYTLFLSFSFNLSHKLIEAFDFFFSHGSPLFHNWFESL